MDTYVEWPQLYMPESERPFAFPFDQCKDNYMKFPHMTENERTSKSPVDRNIEKNSSRVSEDLKMTPLLRSQSTTASEGRKKNYNLRVSEELNIPNMFDRTLGLFRSPSTLSTHSRSRRQEQSVPPKMSNTTFSTLRETIVKNWILVKDNSSPFSWWKQFKDMDFLPKSALKDLDRKTTNIERKDLAELLIIKALQANVCTSVEQIEVLKKIFLKGIEDKLIQKKTEHTQIESDGKKMYDCFRKYKKEWEKCLNRQDVIEIKDHLLQENFITFEDNEELVKDVNYYQRSKEHLFSQIVQKVDEGSCQCFIRHAENIIRQKQNGQKLLEKITDQPRNIMHPAKRSVLITKEEESFPMRDTHKGQKYELSIKMTNEKGKEETGVYQSVQKNSDAINVGVVRHLKATSDGISFGSVVIHFHPLDRDTRCIFDGNVVKLIDMMLQEVMLDSKIQSGKYKLTAAVNITQYVNKTVAECEPLTHEINFVTDEKSFLVEEIDIDAVFEGFKMRNITIDCKTQTDCRKQNARDLLNAIIKNNLEDDFIHILREYKMTYILNRYEAYMNVYKSETAVLRRNIINQFLSIIQCVDIDDIREVLLNQGVTKESMLTELVYKFENRRDVAMATLITECLKSGNAIHAFAYALFLQEHNPLFVNNSLQETKDIEDSEDENESGKYPVEHSLVYSGCFNITIGDKDVQDGAALYNKEKRLQNPVSASYFYDRNPQREDETNYGITPQLTNRLDTAYTGFRAPYFSSYVQDGAALNNKEKRLQNPVSASYFYDRYPQREHETNYGFIPQLTNRLDTAYTGFRLPFFKSWLCNEYRRDIQGRLLNVSSSNRARTTTANVTHTGIGDYLSDWLSMTSIDERRESKKAIDVAKCDKDNRISSNNVKLSEIALSSASTIGTTNFGDSTQIAANSYTHRMCSATSTIYTSDSGYSTQLEADGNTHMISSAASTLVSAEHFSHLDFKDHSKQ